MFRHRDALALLFQALGLESRKAGDEEETGYGIPDQGYTDSEAVIKQVCAEREMLNSVYAIIGKR